MNDSKINKNTFFNALKTASSIIFPFITVPYISRVLQPEGVGKVNFGNSIISYISLMASLGITTYAIRECAKVKNNQNELNKVSSQILSINMLTTVLSYLVLFALLLSVDKLKDYKSLIIIQSLSVFFVTIGADWINSAMEDFKYLTVRTVAFQCISLILMFLFVRNPNDYYKYAIISVIAISGGNVVNLFYRKKFCKTTLTFDMDLKRHLPPILGLFAMLVAQQVFTACDTTIIGLTRSDLEVGLYSTAIKLYNIVNQVMTSITWVVFPQLSIAFMNKDTNSVRKLLKYVVQYTSTFGVPCAIGMFMMSDEIIMFIGGELYIDSSLVIKLLAVTLMASLIGNYVMNINLLAAGKDKICLISCLVAAIVNVTTNILFIPRYGINAAAITTIIAQFTVVLICLPFISKEIDLLQIIKFSIKPLISSVGLCVVIILVKNMVKNIYFRLPIAIVIGGFLYFALLLTMKYEFIMDILKDYIFRNKKNIYRESAEK